MTQPIFFVIFVIFLSIIEDVGLCIRIDGIKIVNVNIFFCLIQKRSVESPSKPGHIISLSPSHHFYKEVSTLDI